MVIFVVSMPTCYTFIISYNLRVSHICFRHVESHGQKGHSQGQDPNPDPRLDSFQQMTTDKIFIEKVIRSIFVNSWVPSPSPSVSSKARHDIVPVFYCCATSHPNNNQYHILLASNNNHFLCSQLWGWGIPAGLSGEPPLCSVECLFYSLWPLSPRGYSGLLYMANMFFSEQKQKPSEEAP